MAKYLVEMEARWVLEVEADDEAEARSEGLGSIELSGDIDGAPYVEVTDVWEMDGDEEEVPQSADQPKEA